MPSASKPNVLTPAVPTPMDALIRRELSNALLKAQSLPLSAFVVALFFWVTLYFQLFEPNILLWAFFVHASQIERYVTSVRYQKLELSQRDPESTARRYSNSIAVSGLIWGLAPWMFFPKDNMPLVAFMMLVILCVSSATIAGFAPSRRAVFSFQIPLYCGVISALLWQGNVTYVSLGLATIVYPYVNIHFGLQQNKLLTDSLRTRFEKESLAVHLAEQVRIVERASLEKTRFFASASHDLRQPLHSLGLFGSAVQARLKGTPDEALARNLMHCVDALETSFSSMLDLSKLDAGVVDVHAKPVALSQVFQKLESVFGKQAEAQGLHLRFRTGGKWVHADAALLERLLGNLVHNALKFTTTGGVVVLARTRAAGISIEVWDSGAGMDALELPRIFDEFYQVGNQERDRTRGLGMGLAIVQRLAALMGLNLRVYSRAGRGTVFKLGVPMALAQALPPPAVAQSLSSGVFRALSHMHILVVDDEETVRTSTADALRLYGFQVEVAGGVAQAREATLRLGNKLDCLITDFRLADAMDGIDLAADLRALLGRQIPTLLVTGDTAPERVRKAQLSGLRVLYKPVKVHTLVEEIRQQITQAK